MATKPKNAQRDVMPPPVYDSRINEAARPDTTVTHHSFGDRPPLIDGKPTVDGKPIPEQFAGLIHFAHTDQGRWDTNSKCDQMPSRVSVGKEPLDKAMDQRLDQPWANIDPLKSAIDKVSEPGFKYRALSEKVCDKRGDRGWETVLDKDGNKVKVGRLFLGRMPTPIAEQRNEHYRKIGSEDLKNVEESMQIEAERARHNGSKGISALRPGDELTDHRDPSRTATVGFDSSRGA
jgi:hypothetical protein